MESRLCYRFLCVLWMCLITIHGVLGNSAPVLSTSKFLVLQGKAAPGASVSTVLKGYDPDKNHFRFRLQTPPLSAFINKTTLSSTGTLTFSNICQSCTGTTSMEIVMEDSLGLSKVYKLTVELRDRSLPRLDLVPQGGDTPRLLRFHIYLIILGAILVVGVISSLVMYNCCSFETDVYTAPIKRNKVVDSARRTSEMNPYAQPKRVSLIVKEAVRSGAADGAPYYGVRKSGVWVPTAPEDNESKGQPKPLRLQSISEDPEMARLRQGRDSIAPVRPSRLDSIRERRLVPDRSSLEYLSWRDISNPRV